jgi:uracil-DNA glycosylase
MMSSTEPHRRACEATALERLLEEVSACRVCVAHLPLGPRPIVQIGRRARLLIASQAPGRIAHQRGIPFDDRAGDNLRAWLAIERAAFYDPERIAILPLGFCYPGRGRGGDLPPRPECAPLWHARLLAHMPDLRLTLLLGRHAQRHHLGTRCQPTLTETVRRFAGYLPACFPLPHPSPRNGPWFRRHPWFEREVLFALRVEVGRALS